jgi:endoglucanase
VAVLLHTLADAPGFARDDIFLDLGARSAAEAAALGVEPGARPAEIQRSNGGVPTVNIVVPVRYTHAHNGVMDRADFDRTVDLVVAVAKRLDAATVARLRDFTP